MRTSEMYKELRQLREAKRCATDLGIAFTQEQAFRLECQAEIRRLLGCVDAIARYTPQPAPGRATDAATGLRLAGLQ